jgi:dipeptidyl aminopeptidase/acylaminoacyl peptidase
MVSQPTSERQAPWKARFRAPVVLWTRVAPSAPDRGVAVTNRSGVHQLYGWEVPGGQLHQLTHRPEGHVLGAISADGRHVYYLSDEKGNEIGHYVRVPFSGGDPEDITPHLEPYSSVDLDFSAASSVAAFTAAGSDGFQLYCVEVPPDGERGAPRLLYGTKSLAFSGGVSSDGAIAVLASTERTGKLRYALIAFETSTGARLGELWDGPESSLQPVMFSPAPGDDRFLATTDRYGDRRPLLWDVRTGERSNLDLPDLDGDVVPFDWSSDARRLLLCQTHRAVQRLHVFDVETGRARPLSHPGGTFGFWDEPATYFTPGGEIFAGWQDATHPSQVIALDGETGEQRRTVLAGGDVPPGRPWESVTFSSSDGQVIQAWLALPEGEPPFPAILETHGGPEAVTTERFAPRAQAWLDHGFCFLTINYRGSTTFGRAFKEQIWGQPGDWEVKDMVAGRQWLVDQGIARPDQILLTGWSYGGFLTLQALGTRPELWAAGMAGIAVADWVSEFEDENEILRGFDIALFGGSPAEKREQYERSSPITYAEQVKAPVLIIQGRNDTRCPDRQVELYEAKMRSLGKPIEVHWFDAGHAAFANVELAIEHQQLMLDFALRVLREKDTRERETEEVRRS